MHPVQSQNHPALSPSTCPQKEPLSQLLLLEKNRVQRAHMKCGSDVTQTGRRVTPLDASIAHEGSVDGLSFT